MREAMLLVTTLCLSTPGLSAGLPIHYPRAVHHQGTINLIDMNRRSVAIGDMQFFYTGTTRTYRPDGIGASFDDLQVGQKVGCNYTKDGGRRALSEVWVLPDGVGFHP